MSFRALFSLFPGCRDNEQPAVQATQEDPPSVQTAQDSAPQKAPEPKNRPWGALEVFSDINKDYKYSEQPL